MTPWARCGCRRTRSTAPRPRARWRTFPISGLRFPRRFPPRAGAHQERRGHGERPPGHLPAELAVRIAAAADQVAAGEYDDQFVVDIFQTGSGTSTNMNANEVIGRLAGAHPNDDVNRGQSSNDVIPTAMHIAAAEEVHGRLCARHGRAAGVARAQGRRIRRRHQDRPHAPAGRRAHAAGAGVLRLRAPGGGGARSASVRRSPGIYELPLGGTAVGTGLNAPPGFAAAVIAEIGAAHRAAVRRGAQPLRGAGGARRGLLPERGAAHLRGGAHQDRQRYPLARLRPALRHRRDCGCRRCSRAPASCRAR